MGGALNDKPTSRPPLTIPLWMEKLGIPRVLVESEARERLNTKSAVMGLYKGEKTRRVARKHVMYALLESICIIIALETAAINLSA